MFREFFTNEIVYPLYFKLKGVSTKKIFNELKAIDFYSQEELKQYQLFKIKNLIEYSYHNIPFYKHLYDKNNVKIDKIKSLEDLQYLPIINKNLIIENLDLIKNKELPYKIRKSSGTSGQSVNFEKDYEAYVYLLAAGWVALSWYNISPGDTQVRFWGGELGDHTSIKSKINDFVHNYIKLSVFEFSRDNLYRFYKKIMNKKKYYIYAYPSALINWCNFLKENNLKLKFAPKAVISTAETLSVEMERYIGEVLKAPVVNEYGCAEVGVISYTCPHGNQHVLGQNVFMEIVNDAGELVKNGEEGNVVITELHNRRMPLIRYQNGDQSSFKIETNCECGLPYPLTERLKGRELATLECENGNIMTESLFYYQLKHIRAYQVIQMDKYDLLYKIYANDKDQIDESKIIKEVRKVLGSMYKVTFEYTDTFYKTKYGKQLSFIPFDKLNSDQIVKEN